MTRRAGPAEWLFRALCLVILVFLMLPTLLILPVSFSPSVDLAFPPRGMSLRWYRLFLTDPGWVDATLFSLGIAALTTACSAVIGTMASIALVRGRLPGRQTLEALMLAPLIVPHIIVAIAVYLQFAPLGLTGTRLGFVLIHTALAVPYVVLVVSAALQRLPPSLEMAGLNLGASRLRCFWSITMPLISPAILAGAVFSALASFDETVVSFFISGVEHQTITRKMFEDIEFNVSPVIAAASTVFVIGTVALMWFADAAKRAATRRSGA
ncbi:MAG: ABC transporter permease [Janthinobacterium lividum]